MKSAEEAKGIAGMEALPEFMRLVQGRILMGALVYGNQSFKKPAVTLVSEIEQELLDVCGWSFILWCRLREVKKCLREQTECDASSARTSTGVTK